MNHKFALFYVTFIAVALVGSLYAGRLNPSWNRKVFTFPPETQKVVENGTAIMEIKWRWLPDTLEMIVKVNDDEIAWDEIAYGFTRDELSILFDSDHNGQFSNCSGYHDKRFDDHGVFAGGGNNKSGAMRHCYITSDRTVRYPCSLSGLPLSGVLVAMNFSNTYSVYKEGGGYTFKFSIPEEFISVEPPTPIYITYSDGDYLRWLCGNPELPYEQEKHKALLVAEFEV